MTLDVKRIKNLRGFFATQTVAQPSKVSMEVGLGGLEPSRRAAPTDFRTTTVCTALYDKLTICHPVLWSGLYLDHECLSALVGLCRQVSTPFSCYLDNCLLQRDNSGTIIPNSPNDG